PEQKARVAVGEGRQPMRLHTEPETLDVSCHHCRHMASNGREWTNSFTDRTPVANALRGLVQRSGTALVTLRGKRFDAADGPLLFTDLLDVRGERAVPNDSLRFVPGMSDYDVGFRVVLKVP